MSIHLNTNVVRGILVERKRRSVAFCDDCSTYLQFRSTHEQGIIAELTLNGWKANIWRQSCGVCQRRART